MSPSASIDYRSALQVAPKRIARLEDAELGELMGQLLRAQSHRSGAPLSEVRTNTQEKAADGGADALSGKPATPDEWLGDAETCWQLKAGKAGTPAAVKGPIALACLETVVHGAGLPVRRWLVAIDVPQLHWQARTELAPEDLPGWLLAVLPR
jgi:hypothetical protein